MKNKNNIPGADNFPNLEKLKNRNYPEPFSVPEGYFDDLQSSIYHRIQNKEKGNPAFKPLGLKPIQVLTGSLAILAIIISLVIWQSIIQKQYADEERQYEELKMNAKDVFMFEIEDYLLLSDIIINNSMDYEPDIITTQEEKDEIIDYLIQQNEVEFLILNEL